MKELKLKELYAILKGGVAAVPITFICSYFLFAPRYGLEAVWLTVACSVLGVGLDIIYGVVIDVPNNLLVTWWEHYDWGFVYIIIGNVIPPFYPLFGLGMFLLVAEYFHRYPFSYGELNFEKTTLVGVIMTILTLLSFIWRYW